MVCRKRGILGMDPVLTDVKTGWISKSFSKVVKSCLNSDPFVKHNFSWTRVSAYICFVKQLDKNVWWFIYIFIITCRYLVEVECWYLDDFEPACGGVNHRHAGYDIILMNDGAARLLLYYWLVIWTYQVYMHQIPRF